MNDPLLWLALTLFCIVAEGFYSSMEMAMVSFNKVKLHYYVGKKNKRALWLNWLLHHPSRLFGTTLFGVNIAMQFGSEASRRLYASMNLDADLAPITQVFLVLIFAELAPIFGARRYSERVAMMGMPLIFLSSKVLKPMITLVKWLLTGLDHLLGATEVQNPLLVSREELQSVIESFDEETPAETEEFNVLARNIFKLKNKNIESIMIPLDQVRMFSSKTVVSTLREKIRGDSAFFFPIYQTSPERIVAIVSPRDLIRAGDNQRIRDFSRPAWFITIQNDILEILNQFRQNNQSVAVALDVKGKAKGIVTLDAVLEVVFGKIPTGEQPLSSLEREVAKVMVIDRAFPGTLTVQQLNELLDIKLSCPLDQTLAEVMTDHLGGHLEVGDSIFIDPFELSVDEISLLEIKSVRVKTR